MRKLNISYAKSYIDKNTNATKTKWVNIGSLVIGDDGKVFGEIEALPVGATELTFNCFDRENNNQQQQPQQHYQAPHGQVPIYNEPAPQQQTQQQAQQYGQHRR